MSSHPHLLVPSSPSRATVVVGGNGGFYLRHGYLEGELTFMSFVTLFREASHSSQALSREPIREAIYGVGGEVGDFSPTSFPAFLSSSYPCLPMTKLLSAVAEDSDPADEGQAMFEHLAKHAQKLWRITEEDGRNGQKAEGAAAEDDILFKVSIPTERAKLWQMPILTVSQKHQGGEGGERVEGGQENDEEKAEDVQESTVTVATQKNKFKEEAEEARTVTCGVANTDRNFVTLTVADGQGLVAWLRCCALYCHNELMKEVRVLAFEAKEKVIREFDDEALTAENAAADDNSDKKNDEDNKTENLLQLRQRKIDAAVREALENFIPPPRPPLVLTAYSKVREQRVHYYSHATKSAAEAGEVDDGDGGELLLSSAADNKNEKERRTVEVSALRSYHESLRYRPTHATLMPIELAETLFSSGLTSAGTGVGPRGVAPIILRNTKNDNFIVLPNPCDESVRVSWASLIQQSRHVWGVLRPIFQYLVRESGVRSLMTITNPEQFSVWKRQLSAALLTAYTKTKTELTESSASNNTIVFELRVYENASEEEVSVERRPLPTTPIRLDSMLKVRPPFFISTAPLTRGLKHIPHSTSSEQRNTISNGTHTSTNGHNLNNQEALEVRARASADAAERYTYKQLHSSLSLEVVNILNRIENYTRNGGGLSAVPTVSSPAREAKEEDGSPSIPTTTKEDHGMLSAWDRVGIDEERNARMRAYEKKMSSHLPSVTGSALDYASYMYTAQPPTSPAGYNEARGLAALHRRKLEKLLGDAKTNRSVPQAQQSPQKNNPNNSDFLPHIASSAPSSASLFPGQRHHQGPPLPLKSHRDALLKAANGEAHVKEDREKQSASSSFLPSPRGAAGGNYSLRNLTVDDLTSPYRVHSSSSSSAPRRSPAYYYSVVLTDPFGPKYTIPALHGRSTGAATGSGDLPIGEFELHGEREATSGNTHRINGPTYREGGDERGGLAAAQRHLRRLTQNAERSASLAAAVAVAASPPRHK